MVKKGTPLLNLGEKMTYRILYNPKSKRGKTFKNIEKLKSKLIKKGHQVSVGSLLEIENTKEYLNNLSLDEKIIIFGGDGTLHYLANELAEIDVKHEIFVARKAGTGNDFVRSIKSKTDLIKINDYIKDIPYELIDGKKKYFINSVGFGLDAQVCAYVEGSEKGKTEGNYFKSALKAISKANKFEINLEIDGKATIFKDVWFVVVCNSRYFGGGMKISPRSVRLDDKLEVVVVNKVKRWMLLLIFPTIYLGIHKMFRWWVHFYSGKKIKIVSDRENYVEYDGEVELSKKELIIFR